MSLKFPNLTNTPPGQWRYRVPETGHLVGHFSNWPQLRDNLKAHYASAGYQMPSDIFELVQAQICQEQESYCTEAPSFIQRIINAAQGVSHTFHGAYSCMVTLMSNRASSGEKPTQDLADSRAAVCAECPQNGPIESCSTCNMGTLNRLVERIVGASKTQSDAKLQFCQVCHCNLRAKVWTKHEAIWNHTSADKKAKFPETCWLKTEVLSK